MRNTASNYNITKLYAGITLAVASTFLSTIAVGLTQHVQSSGFIWLVVLIPGYGASMFATSFVEEEHHFWYWIISGWLAWLQFSTLGRLELQPQANQLFTHHREIKASFTRQLAPVITLVITRFCRRWNQTGQKHAGAPDIGRTYLRSYNLVLWTLVVGTYISVLYRLGNYGFPRLHRHISLAFAFTISSAALGFKIAFTKADAPELLNGVWEIPIKALFDIPLVVQARVVFLGIACTLLLAIICQPRGMRKSTSSHSKHASTLLTVDIGLRPLNDLLMLFLATQSRVSNIPLLLLYCLQIQILESLALWPDEITFTQLLFQFSSFFAFGGSNAISSIDLSSAYNGVKDYNAVAVGILTFVGNWAGPISGACELNTVMAERFSEKSKVLLRHHCLLTLFTSSSLAFVMLACTTLRTHLFIWTVFSPKYLYSMAWILGQHICVNLILGGLIFWIESN